MPSPNRLRAPKTLLVSLLAAAAVLATGCGLLPEEEEILPPPLLTPKAVSYQTLPVVRGDLVLQEDYVFFVSPAVSHALSFRTQGGRLRALPVTAGQAVKAGDLIAELDSGTLKTEIRIQELEVRKSELQLQKLKDTGADATSVQVAALSLEQLRLRLSLQKDQLAATQLRAPIDGKVTYVGSYAIGDSVGAYATIAIVADTSRLQLVAKGNAVSRLPLGAAVSVAFENGIHAATVVANGTTLYDDPDKTMREAAVLVLADGLPDGAALGDGLRGVFVSDRREGVLVLPRSAVRMQSGRRYVDLLVDGVRTERDVEVGLTTATECEIVQGVSEGDLAIVG